MNANPSKSRVRRGRRIGASVPVMLHWRESQGPWHEVQAETKVLSRHGCLLSCSARIKLTDEVSVWWMEKMRCADARVVFRKLSTDGAVEIALEFLDNDDFWSRDFSTIGILSNFRGRAPLPS